MTAAAPFRVPPPARPVPTSADVCRAPFRVPPRPRGPCRRPLTYAAPPSVYRPARAARADVPSRVPRPFPRTAASAPGPPPRDRRPGALNREDWVSAVPDRLMG